MDIKKLLGDAYKEGMTAEEITKALESIESPADNSSELEKLRNALTKSNSEAASYKKQLNEKLSADELKAKEDAEKQEKLQNDYDALMKKVTVSENKAKLLGLGYEDKLADETALAMANGDLDKVFANQKKHLEAVEKKIRADILKDTPKPDGGNADKPITKEQFVGMSYAERAKLYNENPEEYKTLTEQGGN